MPRTTDEKKFSARHIIVKIQNTGKESHNHSMWKGRKKSHKQMFRNPNGM